MDKIVFALLMWTSKHPCIRTATRRHSVSVVAPSITFMLALDFSTWRPCRHRSVQQIGRVRTDLRRALYRLFGKRVLMLDPYLRNHLCEDKRRAWIKDQY